MATAKIAELRGLLDGLSDIPAKDFEFYFLPHPSLVAIEVIKEYNPIFAGDDLYDEKVVSPETCEEYALKWKGKKLRWWQHLEQLHSEEGVYSYAKALVKLAEDMLEMSKNAKETDEAFINARELQILNPGSPVPLTEIKFKLRVKANQIAQIGVEWTKNLISIREMIGESTPRTLSTPSPPKGTPGKDRTISKKPKAPPIPTDQGLQKPKTSPKDKETKTKTPRKDKETKTKTSPKDKETKTKTPPKDKETKTKTPPKDKETKTKTSPKEKETGTKPKTPKGKAPPPPRPQVPPPPPPQAPVVPPPPVAPEMPPTADPMQEMFVIEQCVSRLRPPNHEAITNSLIAVEECKRDLSFSFLPDIYELVSSCADWEYQIQKVIVGPNDMERLTDEWAGNRQWSKDLKQMQRRPGMLNYVHCLHDLLQAITAILEPIHFDNTMQILRSEDKLKRPPETIKDMLSFDHQQIMLHARMILRKNFDIQF